MAEGETSLRSPARGHHDEVALAVALSDHSGRALPILVGRHPRQDDLVPHELDHGEGREEEPEQISSPPHRPRCYRNPPPLTNVTGQVK